MHTGILLAVEADDKESAVAQAESFAEYAEWSDWNEQGGRFAKLEESVLRYSDNPELFMDLVEKHQAFTEDEIRDALDRVGNLTVSELVINPRYRLFGDEDEDSPSIETKPKDTMEAFSVFSASRVLRLVAGYFTADTHFWDISWGTRSSKNLKARIEENPDKQYVIVWDFHH